MYGPAVQNVCHAKNHDDTPYVQEKTGPVDYAIIQTQCMPEHRKDKEIYQGALVISTAALNGLTG